MAAEKQVRQGKAGRWQLEAGQAGARASPHHGRAYSALTEKTNEEA